MKFLTLVFFLFSTVFYSTAASASGTWDCQGDGVAVGGTYSSAGYSVTFFEYDGGDVGNVTLTGIFADDAHLMIEIKDDNANQTLFTLKAFKTPSGAPLAKSQQGYDWVGGGLFHVTIGAEDYWGSALCLGSY